MVEIEVPCVKVETVYVGSGIHRCVLRAGEMAIKVHLIGKRDAAELGRKAREIDGRNRELRKTIDFLPEYHGAVVAAVKKGGSVVPAVLTFHEYVEPIRSYTFDVLMKLLRLIARSADAGYVLDMKPSNFGLKGERVVYLDEYGIGKGPIPPDVIEDLAQMVEEILRRVGLEKR